MKYKCKCGKVKDFHKTYTTIKNGQKLTSAICDCGLGMDHVPEKDMEFPSVGVQKGSSNFPKKQ